MSTPSDLSLLQPGSPECLQEYSDVVMIALSKLRAISDYHSIAPGVSREMHKQEAGRHFDAVRGAFGMRVKPFGRNLPDHLNRELVLTEELASEWAQIRAEERVPLAIGIHDSAVIVFAHSVFEGVVHDLFTFDFRCNPESWESRFAKREVEFQQATQMDIHALRIAVWQKERNEIERQRSLQDNVNHLLNRCEVRNAEKYAALREVYKLNIDIVRKLDKLRQDLVHKTPVPSPISDAKAHLAYILRTTAMVFHCCGICLFDLPVAGIGMESIFLEA